MSENNLDTINFQGEIWSISHEVPDEKVLEFPIATSFG